MKLIEPNLENSEAVSYFLGVRLGDMSIYKNAVSLQISPKDKKFGESFRDCLRELGLNSKMHYYEFRGNGFREGARQYLMVSAGSIKLVRWLRSLSYEGVEKIATGSNESMVAFIRGFYESEGCNYTKNYTKSSRPRSWMLSMANTNSELVRLVSKILSRLDFKFSVYSKKATRVRTGEIFEITSADISRNMSFLSLIKPSIRNNVPTWVFHSVGEGAKRKERIRGMLEREYVRNEKSITDTAKSIGKGRKFVEFWLKKLEIPTRGKAYWNKLKRKALNLRDIGITYKQIGKELGISAAATCKWTKVR